MRALYLYHAESNCAYVDFDDALECGVLDEIGEVGAKGPTQGEFEYFWIECGGRHPFPQLKLTDGIPSHWISKL